MQVICQIHIKAGLKHDMCSHVEVQRSLGVHKSIPITTSSNHAEVIALHETSGECVLLRFVTQHIQATCRLLVDRDPTVLLEDILHASLKCKKDLSKATEPNTYP